MYIYVYMKASIWDTDSLLSILTKMGEDFDVAK